MSRKILFIAPHPDDETLGCGGTILRHQECGDRLYWLIVTQMSKRSIWPSEVVEKRANEIKKVASIYEFEKTVELGLDSTSLDAIPMSRIVESISSVVNDIKPDTIFVNAPFDIHTDHQIVFQATMSSVKNFRCKSVQEILLYETLSETEYCPPLGVNGFQPNTFVDITPWLAQKTSIMSLYETEVMSPPGPRNDDVIAALARYRGSRISVDFAEAFMSIFRIYR